MLRVHRDSSCALAPFSTPPPGRNTEHMLRAASLVFEGLRSDCRIPWTASKVSDLMTLIFGEGMGGEVESVVVGVDDCFGGTRDAS